MNRISRLIDIFLYNLSIKFIRPLWWRYSDCICKFVIFISIFLISTYSNRSLILCNTNKERSQYSLFRSIIYIFRYYCIFIKTAIFIIWREGIWTDWNKFIWSILRYIKNWFQIINICFPICYFIRIFSYCIYYKFLIYNGKFCCTIIFIKFKLQYRTFFNISKFLIRLFVVFIYIC